MITRVFIVVLLLVTPRALAAQSDSASAVPVEVKSQGETVRASLHLAAGPGPHPTVVLLKGFPGNNSPAFATFLQSKGFNAISVNFRGQLDSDGNYDVGGTPADATAVIAFLRSDSARRVYRVDPKRIALSGASAGSFATLSAAAADKSIHCVNVIVPFNWTVTLVSMRTNPIMRTALVNQVQSIANRNPPPVRLDSAFATRTLDSAEAYDLRQVAPRLGGRNVFMIGAQYDSTAPLATHFNPVRDSLRNAKAAVRDTILDDTHNLTATVDRVYDLVARWLDDCSR